jgi:hypothetical protein
MTRFDDNRLGTKLDTDHPRPYEADQTKRPLSWLRSGGQRTAVVPILYLPTVFGRRMFRYLMDVT